MIYVICTENVEKSVDDVTGNCIINIKVQTINLDKILVFC